MRLDVLEAMSDHGDGLVNEDRFGSGPAGAWIIDGATPVDPPYLDPASDARWLAQFVDRRLASLAAGAFSAGAGPLLGDLATEVQAAVKAVGIPGDAAPPACSVGILTLAGDTLRWDVLGDVQAVVQSPEGSLVRWSNDRFDITEGEATAQMPPGTRSAAALRQGADGIRERRRSYVAGANGKYVFSVNPSVGAGVQTEQARVAPGCVVLLMTDGFARLVSSYRVHDSWETLFQACQDNGIAAEIKRLRKYEDESRAMSRRHFKSRDDATAALNRIDV